MKFSEIIKNNKALNGQLETPSYKIAILSNIMVHQTKDICEYWLRSDLVNADVLVGGYDNIVQDSHKFKESDAVIIFWETCNILDGLQYKIELMGDKEIDEIALKVKLEIDIVLKNLKKTSLVIINKFSSLVFNRYSINMSKLNLLENILNEYLEVNIRLNVRLVDIEKIISNVSIDKAIDLRFYYSSKTFYSFIFYKKYFQYIKPMVLAAVGRTKKALILDCDNTLWKGILGEDGFDNIKVFEEIQYLSLMLSRRGVIVGLCSKNNLQDVNEVLDNHPDMILRDKDIVIKKINWNDKVTNLREIAKELNIGLDSIVFLDDSDFEVDLVRSELPEVRVYKVPANEHEYGVLFRRVASLFYSFTNTREDRNKVQFYKDQIKRADVKGSFGDIESYLATLGLKLTLYKDDLSQVERLAQLSQKTNQFNLTTKRYTEVDVINIIKSTDQMLMSFSVSDKYGDSGITGLAVFDFRNSMLDSLLLSCRVLGRNIEFAFMNAIVEMLKQRGLFKIESSYVRTVKNDQVSNFYEKCGFSKNIGLRTDSNIVSSYFIILDDYKNINIDYIEVVYGE